ncbi:MAG: hypothetical protein J6Y93_03920 [Treponema sp.]|nr:hypothetical protein [Treponema sp.]
MKALLIADNDLYIENITSVLKSAGYDTIVYKWLLKALDNIEEIAPHLIIVSTEEYPRHWKTLAQFAQVNFGDYTPQVVLFTGKNFDEEEQKKADILGVRGVFSSVDVEGLDKLREILKTKVDIYSGKLTDSETHDVFESNVNLQEEDEIAEDIQSDSDTFESDDVEPASDEYAQVEKDSSENEQAAEYDESLSDEDEDTVPETFDEDEPAENETIPCSFIFTNPVTLSIVPGTARNYNGQTLEYTADFEESIKAVSKGTLLTCATLKAGAVTEYVRAEVLSVNDKNLLLEIRKSA